MRQVDQHCAARYRSGPGVSLSVGNYAAISSKPVATDDALIDLFSYKPADFALVAGGGVSRGWRPCPPQRPDRR